MCGSDVVVFAVVPSVAVVVPSVAVVVPSVAVVVMVSCCAIWERV